MTITLVKICTMTNLGGRFLHGSGRWRIRCFMPIGSMRLLQPSIFDARGRKRGAKLQVKIVTIGGISGGKQREIKRRRFS